MKRTLVDQCPRCGNMMSYRERDNTYRCACGAIATPEYLRDLLEAERANKPIQRREP